MKKCFDCGKGKLVDKKIEQMLYLDGAPPFKVNNVQAEVCDVCGIEYTGFHELHRSDKEFLDQILQYYFPKNHEMPGKVAQWIYQTIDLPLKDLAAAAKVSDSSLSKAAKKNTMIDRVAAIFLLMKARDWLKGGEEGERVVHSLDDLNEFFGLGALLKIKDDLAPPTRSAFVQHEPIKIKGIVGYSNGLFKREA